MTPLEIQFELKRREITQKSIAIEEDVHPVQIYKAIKRKGVSDRIMKAISRKIETDHRIVFNDYYLKKATE